MIFIKALLIYGIFRTYLQIILRNTFEIPKTTYKNHVKILKVCSKIFTEQNLEQFSNLIIHENTMHLRISFKSVIYLKGRKQY